MKFALILLAFLIETKVAFGQIHHSQPPEVEKSLPDISLLPVKSMEIPMVSEVKQESDGPQIKMETLALLQSLINKCRELDDVECNHEIFIGTLWPVYRREITRDELVLILQMVRQPTQLADLSRLVEMETEYPYHNDSFKIEKSVLPTLTGKRTDLMLMRVFFDRNLKNFGLDSTTDEAKKDREFERFVRQMIDLRKISMRSTPRHEGQSD